MTNRIIHQVHKMQGNYVLQKESDGGEENERKKRNKRETVW